MERMKFVIDSRLAATEKKFGETSLPRVIRTGKKLDWTENETTLAVYALVEQCGYDRKDLYGGATDAIAASLFLGIPLKEVLGFLSEDRTHMNQGFFPEVLPGYILNSSITYDLDFCKVLVGAQLKSEEFLKIEQTVLADVIVEEPGNEHYRYLRVSSLSSLSLYVVVVVIAVV